MGQKRIIELDSLSTVTDNDYIAVDNATGGTKKYPLKSVGGSSSGLTDDIKQALLQIAEKVAYIDDDGQDYYDALEDALYPVTPPVTVSYITCVYTQSGTVYATDELSSLRSDLVVTAHYSDSTSAVVNMYTLSGILTEGTSTITVTYISKTTTFNVTVTGSLVPTGYTAYDYVEQTATDGTAQATGRMIHLATYSNLNRIGIEFKALSKEVLNGLAIIGGRPSSGSTTSFAFYSSKSNDDSKFGFHLHGADTSVSIPYEIETVHEIVYTGGTSSPSKLKVDGTEYSITWVNDNTINANLTLFSNPVGTGNQRISNNIQIGRIKVYDTDGVLINDYVPCKSPSNIIGMYDRVGGTFYSTSDAVYATIGDSSCRYALGNWT